MQVVFNDEYMLFDAKFEFRDVAKSIFGCKGWRNKNWQYEPTPRAAFELYQNFELQFKSGKVTADERFSKLVDEGREAARVVVSLSGDEIHIKAPYAHYETCKSIPGGAWDKSLKVWKYPRSVAVDLAENFEYFLHDARIDKDFYSLIPKYEGFIPSKLPLWEHQKTAFARAVKHDGYMLAMQMRTGKTAVAIALMNARNAKRVVVFAPKKVVTNNVWLQDVNKFSVNKYTVVELGGKETVPQKAKMIRAAFDTNERVVVVMNYEICYREPISTLLKNSGVDMAIADESHKIKAPGGIASRYLFGLGQRVKYRLALTGTPFANSPADVYGQYRFVDPSIFGTNHSFFLRKYCIVNDYGQPVAFINQDELNKNFYSRAYRVMTADVLDLPERQEFNLTFELGAKARQIYNELEDELFATLGYGDDDKLSLTHTLTKYLRLQQLTGGALPTDDGRDITVDTGKKELLLETLEELPNDEPVVVFCKFSHDIEVVKEVGRELGRGVMEVSGRRDDMRDWQAGVAPIMACQIQAGGSGVDFTRATYFIYYSTGYSLADYEQSLFRGIGEHMKKDRPTIIMHLTAADTIDVKVADALTKKQNVVEAILSKRSPVNVNVAA